MAAAHVLITIRHLPMHGVHVVQLVTPQTKRIFTPYNVWATNANKASDLSIMSLSERSTAGI